MFERPLGSDDTAIKLADWVEIELVAGPPRTSVSIDELADSLTDPPSEDSSTEELTGEGSKSATARQRSEDAFQELAWRAGWLGSRYPLVVQGGGEVALRNGAVESRRLCDFLTLLRARQLVGQRMAEEAGVPDPGFLFEEIVTRATGSYTGTAVRFGVARGGRGDGLPAALGAAIVELGRRMHEEPGTAIGGGIGDYKADAVAWRPFGDRRPGQVVVLCQATISEAEWIEKEIPPRWQDRRLLLLVAPPVPAVAFVETMSLYPTTFWRGATFYSMPLDRLRIMRVLLDSQIEDSILEQMNQWTAWARERLSA